MKKPANLPKVQLNPNAATVLAKRYYRRGPDGQALEDAEGLFWRVASAIAEEERKYQDSVFKPEELAKIFYKLMTDWKFLPNSPTLMNAGTGLGQLSACFVLPIGDSIEEIFDAVKHAAMIHKSGGGTGFSFSRLRPKDSRVGSTGGVASGPLSFLRIFNTATEQIKQGGTRRGANMGILRVDHPDIMEFIRAKEREGEFNNFNLSVALTEDFMKAVAKDEEYPLVAPNTGEVSGCLNAREVFEILVRKAWESGDPGIVFIDRINRDNPTPDQGEMESTNPCGEQPLLPYEACNLGSVNLARFFVPDQKSLESSIDWEDLKRVIHLAVRFLDNVVDASVFPLPQITENVRRNRKIGLGVMGWADLLYQLEIAYDSQEAVKLGEQMMQFIHDEGRSASRQLARERGPFPAFATSVFQERDLGPFRNATVTTIAPTGTLSILAGCSSGVEPLFALSFSRHVLDGEKLVEVNPYFEAALKKADTYSPALMEKVTEKGNIHGLDVLPEKLRQVFVTAMNIAPVWHLRMQAAFQLFTDNAVSKTVNLPHSATQDDIRQIYWMAYEQGCKGVTVYRDGCKSVQVLYSGEAKAQAPGAAAGESVVEEQRRAVRNRPDLIYGFTQKVNTGHGKMYVTINEIDGKPFELFATIGKSGRSTMAKAEAIGRLVSLALRSGIAVADIVAQIKGIGGDAPVFQKGKQGVVQSIPDAIAWILENRYLKARVSVDGCGGFGAYCPNCDGELIFSEGCQSCPICGYNKCG
ncbi:MAG: vitamin B12-dependent ribonucleotide reductase [Deltaproteobacteria bacterium]|jgi:ribonucleoside-diphosphate reductase alpha chain|nr:vitamin B12-dependent ribonucleotide reductase [Deltaproteobacteria bacterium]